MTRAEIEELLAGTTPGPWRACETTIHGKRYGGLWVEGPEVANDDGGLRGTLIPITGSGGATSFTTQVVPRQDHDQNDANARFIAAAPTLARQLLAVMEERDRLVQEAYYEGYSAGYHTGNPQKDIAPDWLGSDARAALQKEQK